MLTGPPPKFHGTRDILRVRYGPELYGKIIRIDGDPPTLFVGASARTGQEGGRGHVGRRSTC